MIRWITYAGHGNGIFRVFPGGESTVAASVRM